MEKRLVTKNVCVMETTQRYFGKLFFPIEKKPVENVWLNIIGKKIFVEIPNPKLATEDWPVLHGEFNKLGTVSLIDCSLGASSHGFGGEGCKLNVHKLIQGEKLSFNRQCFISSITLTSSALNHWIMGIEGITHKKSTFTVPEFKTILNVSTAYFDLEIKIGYKNSFSYTKTSFERDVFLYASFNKPLNIYDFYVWKKKIEKLIVYLTNDDPGVKIIGLNKSIKRIYGIDSKWESHKYSHSIKFSFHEIKNYLSKIIKSWFDNKNLDSVIVLLLEKKAIPALSPQKHFLNMCVALESFHKNFIGKNIPLIDKTTLDNREKIKTLLDKDKELLRWFSKKTTFWKNPTLIDRIYFFKKDLQDINKNVFNIPIGDWMRMVKNTRDDLSHEGRYNKYFEDYFTLFLSSYALEMLLQYRVIMLLGVDDKLLKEQYLKNASGNISLVTSLNNFKGIKK